MTYVSDVCFRFLINLKENCKAYFLKHNDDTRFFRYETLLFGIKLYYASVLRISIPAATEGARSCSTAAWVHHHQHHSNGAKGFKYEHM